jgi:hypothetical protein
MWFIVAGPVGTVKKPERFVRRLFQAARGNHQESPKATFVDFHSLRQFQQAFFLFWSFFLSL